MLLEARPHINSECFTDFAERWRPTKTEEEYSTSVAGYVAHGLRKMSGPTTMETAWLHMRSARELEAVGHTSHLDWDISTGTRHLHSSGEGVHDDIGSASWSEEANRACSTNDGAAGALADDEAEGYCRSGRRATRKCTQCWRQCAGVR